jgi:cyclopropane fatty-acyl-phospholipid synthase-like methyltransferase
MYFLPGESLSMSHRQLAQLTCLPHFSTRYSSAIQSIRMVKPRVSIKMSSLNPPSRNPSKTPSTVRYLDTASAYDLWSEVYDTDGNFLQALDTIEMKTLLPKALESVRSPKPWKLVDLGCGTGRNTLSLLRNPGATVVGLELSPKMLEVARSRIDQGLEQTKSPERAGKVELEVFDMIQEPDPPSSALNADAVISTLVLEHVPVEVFFSKASQILKPDGVFLITNMHSEMGNISQAGFVDPKTGEKVRPQSYAHRVGEVVAEARKQGFELEGDVLERSVDEAGSKALGERAKKWIGVMVWYAMVFRKTSENLQHD